MCGRYTAHWEPVDFQKHFNVQPPLFESYNLAPTQNAPVVLEREGTRKALMARWGLIPKWVDKPFEFKANLFNARAETLSEKASFKRPFKSQRCLVPVSGFYEWDAQKQPYYVRAEDERPLALAGLWDLWAKDDQELLSYTIITTEPNETLQSIHKRMPVVLDVEDFDSWLGKSESGELESLLRPYEGALKIYPVDKRVGRVRENDKGLLEPL